MDGPRTIRTDEIIDDSTITFKDYWQDFLALIKIGIVNSNLITAFTGFWLALFFTGERFFDHWVSFIFVMLGTAFIIAGAAILNNYYDRDIDHKMKRTSKRATITGTISLRAILTMGIAFSIIGVILLYIASPLSALYGFIGWFIYVILYTMWTKRKYTINTVVGCFSGAAPPLVGWAAIDSSFSLYPFVLFLIMFLWQIPHFLSLAMMKNDDYKNAGVPMLPAVRGFKMTKRQILIYTICLLPLPFYLYPLGTIFVIFATILNLGWIVLAFYGIFTSEDNKWARRMFLYSLNYLTLLFIGMVVATIPSFL